MLSSGTYIAIAALAVAVVLAGVAYWTTRRQDRLEAGQRAILGAHDDQDLVTHALELEDQVRNLREAVTILTDEVERYRHDLDTSLSNLAVVRFDAFRDSGGEQSASIALLDGYRSGVIISVFAARDFARIYVKHLDHGVPDRELAPEEAEAMRRAVPQALPRGEVSRAPVSSFPRDVRLAVEQARHAATQASANASVDADAAPARPDVAAAPARPDVAADTPDAPPARPRAFSVSTDEAQPGIDWVEAEPPDDAAGTDQPVGESVAGESQGDQPEPATPRPAKKDDDWLGGDHLEF